MPAARTAAVFSVIGVKVQALPISRTTRNKYTSRSRRPNKFDRSN